MNRSSGVSTCKLLGAVTLTRKTYTYSTELIGNVHQRSAHSSADAERLRAAAVEPNPCDVVLDHLGRLHRQVGVGRAELEDHSRLLNRVALED